MKVSSLYVGSAVLAFTLIAAPAQGQVPRRDPAGFDPADAALLTPRPGLATVRLRTEVPGRTVYVPASLRPEGDTRARRDARPLCITPCAVYLRPGTTTFFTVGAPYDLVDVTVGTEDTEVVLGRERGTGGALPVSAVTTAPAANTARVVGRVALESLGAVGGIGLGGLLGGALLFATGAVCLSFSGGCHRDESLAPLGIAAVILLPIVGATTGTYLVGTGYHRGGSFGWTLLGSAAGLGATMLVLLLPYSFDSYGEPAIPLDLGFSIGVIAWTAATVVAYELSAPGAPGAPNASRPRALRFGPTFAPTANNTGATVGLVGVF